MSRRKSDQIDFGSDSFLDITANIVGILIILIVIAGLRVSQAPVFVEDSQPEPEIVEVVPPESLDKAADIEIPQPEIISEKTVEEVAEKEPEPILPDPELQKEILNKTKEITQLQKQIQNQKLEIRTASQNSGQLQVHLANVSSTRKLAINSASQSRNQFRIKKQKLDQSRRLMEDLTEKLAELDELKAPTQKIKHHFSPVSQEVKGEEIHYRLANNQVAHIPLEQLLGDLKKQIYRQRNWLVKFNQHQGKVGPIKGFSMSYIVSREKSSVLDELRTGQGTVRIGVREWTLNIERGLKAESAETALKPGSRFLDSLQAASGNATLTFWVYPDSYSIYRKIQSFAHQQHFQVAARPLPNGISIAGSPNGSRSSGQ